MKSHVSHLQFNMNPANKSFYADMFASLGWKTLYEEEELIGVGNDGQVSLWFAAATSDVANDHDAPGLNHFGIGVETQADVDATVAYLRERGVELLYGTPCNRPEYASGENDLYYSAMFLSPDQILFEVVYTGPK